MHFRVASIFQLLLFFLLLLLLQLLAFSVRFSGLYCLHIRRLPISPTRGERGELELDTDSDLGVAFDGRLSMPGNKRKMLKNVYSFDS